LWDLKVARAVIIGGFQWGAVLFKLNFQVKNQKMIAGRPNLDGDNENVCGTWKGVVYNDTEDREWAVAGWGWL